MNHNESFFKIIVRADFGAQAQWAYDSGPKDPQQWICKEWVEELGQDRVHVMVSKPCNHLNIGALH